MRRGVLGRAVCHSVDSLAWWGAQQGMSEQTHLLLQFKRHLIQLSRHLVPHRREKHHQPEPSLDRRKIGLARGREETPCAEVSHNPDELAADEGPA